jgi:hypothetical protein
MSFFLFVWFRFYLTCGLNGFSLNSFLNQCHIIFFFMIDLFRRDGFGQFWGNFRVLNIWLCYLENSNGAPITSKFMSFFIDIICDICRHFAISFFFFNISFFGSEPALIFFRFGTLFNFFFSGWVQTNKISF